MIEVHIHWSALGGDSTESVMVDVEPKGIFDGDATNVAIATAMKHFLSLPPLKTFTNPDSRTITRIDVRHCAQKILTP